MDFEPSGEVFRRPGYKRIRRILDGNESDPEFIRLRDDIAKDESSEIVEAFVDYLNFFEFVASLRKLRQLHANEISMLFGYYLRLLRKHDFVRSYVRKYDFEELEALLKECVEGKW